MKQIDFEDLIGEATEYDKKAELEVKKPKSWLKSVSAFANTLGGSMIFGVDNDGYAVGLENPEREQKEQEAYIKKNFIAEISAESQIRFLYSEGRKYRTGIIAFAVLSLALATAGLHIM